jgi:hypothetical protein
LVAIQAAMMDGGEGTTKYAKGAKFVVKEEEKMRNIFARSARNELKFMPIDVAADKTLSALSTTVPTPTPGNREKLSDRIYRIVQDLFFFRKALMKKHVNPVNPV